MTPEQKQEFKEYINSREIKLAKLVIDEYIAQKQAELLGASTTDVNKIFVLQGELRGLNAAKNLIDPQFYVTMENVTTAQLNQKKTEYQPKQ